MNRFLSSSLALTLICTASTALADSLPDLKSLSDSKLIALYEQARTASPVDNCSRLAPILGEMLNRPNLRGPIKGQKALADINCAIKERRWIAAYAMLPEVEEFLGENTGTLGFYIAVFSDHHQDAAERMAKLAGASDGSGFLEIPDEVTYSLFRGLWTGKHFTERKSLALALLGSPHFGKLSLDMQSSTAGMVIDEEARVGRFERSDRLLGKVTSPYRYMTFLSMKQYAPIWRDVEKAAGANMSRIIERDLAAKKAALKANPDDREAFQQVAHGLLFAGRFEEVLKHMASMDHSPGGIAKASEDDAWALNVEAYALDVLGRSAEAEAIFDRLAAIPYDPDKNSWLVNFVINRGSRLVELGQWEKGLEAATLAGQVTEKSGSAYAKMLVRRTKVCALHNLGRGAEAEPLLAEIFEHRTDTYSVAATAMLCANQSDRAAQIVIEALADEVHAEDMVEQLQRPEFELFYTESKLPGLRETLLSRADVRAAFDRVGRDIPDAFIPLAGKRREELRTKSQ